MNQDNGPVTTRTRALETIPEKYRNKTVKFTFDEDACRFVGANYTNGRLRIDLVTVELGAPVAMLTTNIPTRTLRPGEFFVKTWSENEELTRELLTMGIFVDTGVRVAAGRCDASIWRFAP